MKKLIIASLLVATSILQIGCDDIIAKKISSEMPVLIVPAVNDTVQFNPVQFKWEEVKGATGYRLQVVTPGFSNISYFTLDTIVSGTEFYVALDSAQYEMKLTAVNAGYESLTLGPIPFWVGVQPSSGSGTSVALSNPLSGAYKMEGYSGPFSWNTLTTATSYEFSLREGSVFATGTPIYFLNGVSTPNLSLPASINLDEGEYTWGVKAYLSNSIETTYSTRTLYIDGTDPNTPAGTMTPSNSFETGNVTFLWSNGTDTGTIKSPVTSILQIASDSGFASIWAEQSLQGSTISVDMSAATSGLYYWRVYNVDAAGNVSSYSNVHQFNYN